MKRRQLEITLEAAGKPAEQWESSDGTRVLVLPHGGRVLGLFSPDNEENFFWTHPALANKESAEAFYRGNQWHNSGGDRTWVAPEVDFFFPDFPDLRRYWQQRELDPGQYQAARSNGILTWSTRARLTLSRTKGAVDVEITKSLFPALNPLRYEANAGLKSVSYAGYTLQTKLRVLGSAPSAIGLWQLVQMPHAGEMLIPTFSRSEPKLCMGAIADEDLPVSDRLVRYKMRAKGEHKLTMRAATITGRAGYIYAEGAASALVIRNFRVNPSGEYVCPGRKPTISVIPSRHAT